MRSFKDLVTEQKETVVFTFGRFNPPTTGHEKLINKVASVAGSNPFRVYPSQSQDPVKNPLPHSLKVAYMRQMFRKFRKNIIADKAVKTAIDCATKLHADGFKNIIMVVGSDRVQEFNELLTRYNGKPDRKGNILYEFDSVKVVSAGDRDPDAEDVTGMSASKMRAAAADGDKDAFMTGLPSGFKNGDKLYRDVRKYMGIREERDMGDMNDFEVIRDMYLTGKIWNAGDVVEAKGITGEVVRKGTNYLSFVDDNGKVHKAWLHEITLDEAKVEKQSVQKSVPLIVGDRTKLFNEAKESKETLDEMAWFRKLKSKIDQISHPKGFEDMVRVYLDTAKKKIGKQDRDFGVIRTNTASAIAADVAKEYGVSPRVFIQYVNKLVQKGALPKELQAEYKPQNETMSFKNFVDQIQINEKLGKNADVGDYIDDFRKSDAPQFKGKSDKKIRDMAVAAYLDAKDKREKNEGAYGYEKQDPDIKKRKGTQPAKYFKGLAKSTKKKRDAQFKRQAKMADDDPAAYKPAPGDKDAKTKPSVHTKKFKQMYGEKRDAGYPDDSEKIGKKHYIIYKDRRDWYGFEVDKDGNQIGDAIFDPKKGELKKMILRFQEEVEEAPRIPRKKGQPAGSDKHSDLYTDENPKGTIHGLGFKDVKTAKASVKKIEGSDRTHAHKIQAAIAMEQRARVMGKTAEANVYRAYIEKMKKKTKEMQKDEDVRKMPDGGYGVYADKFVKGKRVKTPGGKHAKELKKVYKNKKDANDYMAAIMIAKGGG